MSNHTVTSKGQITLRREYLAHLKIRPGEQVTIAQIPNGALEFRYAPKGDISAFFGILKRRGQRAVSIKEMNDVIADGWAGRIK